PRGPLLSRTAVSEGRLRSRRQPRRQPGQHRRSPGSRRRRTTFVILVDANLLVYSANRAAPEHEAGRAWLDDRFSGCARVGLPWPSLVAFVRLVTNPIVFRQPATPRAAWDQIQSWLSADCVWVPVPTDRHAAVLGAWLAESWITPRLVPDAHLAALAVE